MSTATLPLPHSSPAIKDHSTSIYRSYRRLTSRNLLYLEAELFELEKKLDDFDDEDFTGDFDGKQFARSWPKLNSSDDPRCIERLKCIKEIRATVKEYSKQDLTVYSFMGWNRIQASIELIYS